MTTDDHLRDFAPSSAALNVKEQVKMKYARQTPRPSSQPSPRSLHRGFRGLCAGLLLVIGNGCAALTFPVSGIPTDQLGPEYFSRGKEHQQPLDLTLLRQQRPKIYRLGPKDVLGLWIDGVIGEQGQIPIQAPQTQSIGLPFTVGEDGRLSLPLIAPVRVEGLSLPEAEAAIRQAYIDKQILQPNVQRVIVSMIRPRTVRVLVLRQDRATGLGPDEDVFRPQIGRMEKERRGSGTVVELQAYENDVLTALTRTGGLPGLDSYNEVFIERGAQPAFDPIAAAGQRVQPANGQASPGQTADTGSGRVTPLTSASTHDANIVPVQHLEGIPGQPDPLAQPRIIRIPFRLAPEEPLPFSPQDILLYDGDVVYVEARDIEVFYTGGLLPTGEHVLPRDYDLDVLEAISRHRGPLASGGLQTNFFFPGTPIESGIGGPSPSLVVILRRTPEGGQIPIRVDLNDAIRDPRHRVVIQPGDVVLLQQTPGESLARYFGRAVNFVATFRPWNRADSTGVGTLIVP
jgi:hypothetical protein